MESGETTEISPKQTAVIGSVKKEIATVTATRKKTKNNRLASGVARRFLKSSKRIKITKVAEKDNQRLMSNTSYGRNAKISAVAVNSAVKASRVRPHRNAVKVRIAMIQARHTETEKPVMPMYRTDSGISRI